MNSVFSAIPEWLTRRRLTWQYKSHFKGMYKVAYSKCIPFWRFRRFLMLDMVPLVLLLTGPQTSRWSFWDAVSQMCCEVGYHSMQFLHTQPPLLCPAHGDIA